MALLKCFGGLSPILVVSETCTQTFVKKSEGWGTGTETEIHQHVLHESTFFAKQVNN